MEKQIEKCLEREIKKNINRECGRRRQIVSKKVIKRQRERELEWGQQEGKMKDIKTVRWIDRVQ